MSEMNNENVAANCKTSIPQEKDLSAVIEKPEEFPSGILPELGNTDIINCSNYGVQLHNVPNMLKLTYSGILAKSGAQKVYAEIGYGDNNQWEDTESFSMNKTAQNTFELLTFRKRQGNVNIAFKDDIGNWDNNSGNNYIFYNASNRQ